MDSPYLKVESAPLGDDGHLVRVLGELDYRSAPVLETALFEIDRSVVVVDLASTTFMSAAGIATLVKAKGRIEAEGHELQIINAGRMVRRVFEIVGLGEMVSRRDGLEAFGRLAG